MLRLISGILAALIFALAAYAQVPESKTFDLRSYSTFWPAEGTQADVQAAIDDARDNIIAQIWPSNDPFTRMPDSVDPFTYPVGALTTCATALPGCGSYTQINSPNRLVWLRFNMPKGLIARALYFPAKDSCFSGRLLIFHQGHNNTFTSQETDVLLQANGECDDLLVVWMPLLGPNTVNTADPNWPGTTVRVGASFATHDDLLPFASSSFNPLVYFMEPIIGSINYVSTLRTYTKIGMTGISGGGWSTVLAAALDRRITHAYPVAGSWPQFFWSLMPGVSPDLEQRLPGISHEFANAGYGGDYATYIDLYLMAAYPAPRRLILIYNRSDPCCFAGGVSFEMRPQLQAMKTEAGGGYLDVRIDGTHSLHTISAAARTSWIFPDFVNN